MPTIGKTVRTVKTVKTVKVVKTVRTVSHMGITVTLPEVKGVPVDLWGEERTFTRLLTDGEDNPKLAKSNGAGLEYRTWGLTLSPADESGYEMCASRSAGCARACLHHQGMARVFSSIHVARIAKTIAFHENRPAFLAMLRKELWGIVKRAERKGFIPAVRLNVLSDVMWEKVAPWIFTEFPGIQFYDYTKHAKRMLAWCAGKLPKNYHLTFSRSEDNQEDCIKVLRAGGTVAVVFSTKHIPETWEGFTVVNGDKTDMRFADAPGSVVGLYAKGSASKDETGFVVPSSRFSLNVI